ncbi:MAG: ATP-binding cassette domain-containing protein [Bacteriovoracaceae bacterium]|nr:ATP-binding cassette domain-containing protein [Bacteriovoracaceae bacterium]
MNETFIAIKNLSLFNNKKELILAINEFSLKSGEFIHLVGPSGSGKSLFLKSLIYLYPIQFDTYLFLGLDTSKQNIFELRRKMLYLNQFPELGDKTVSEVYKTFESLKINSPQNWQKKRAEDFISMLSISWSEWLKRPVSYLSGGELQILQHSLASAADPLIYLLDETLSAIDQEKRKLILEYYVKKTKSQQKSVILIDHHTSDMAEISTRDFLSLTTHSRNLVSRQEN